MKRNRSVKVVLRAVAVVACALIAGSIRFLYGSGGVTRASSTLAPCTSPARVCTGQSKNNCAGGKKYQVRRLPTTCSRLPYEATKLWTVTCYSPLQQCWRTVSCTWFSTPPFSSCGIDPFGKFGPWSSVAKPASKKITKG